MIAKEQPSGPLATGWWKTEFYQEKSKFVRTVKNLLFSQIIQTFITLYINSNSKYNFWESGDKLLEGNQDEQDGLHFLPNT